MTQRGWGSPFPCLLDPLDTGNQYSMGKLAVVHFSVQLSWQGHFCSNQLNCCSHQSRAGRTRLVFGELALIPPWPMNGSICLELLAITFLGWAFWKLYINNCHRNSELKNSFNPQKARTPWIHYVVVMDFYSNPFEFHEAKLIPIRCVKAEL